MRPGQPDDERSDHQCRQSGESPGRQLTAAKYPEADSFIPTERKIEKRGNADWLIGADAILKNPPLRGLIHHEPQQC